MKWYNFKCTIAVILFVNLFANLIQVGSNLYYSNLAYTYYHAINAAITGIAISLLFDYHNDNN